MDSDRGRGGRLVHPVLTKGAGPTPSSQSLRDWAGEGDRLALGVYRGRWLLWGSWGRQGSDEAPNETRLTALHALCCSARMALQGLDRGQGQLALAPVPVSPSLGTVMPTPEQMLGLPPCTCCPGPVAAHGTPTGTHCRTCPPGPRPLEPVASQGRWAPQPVRPGAAGCRPELWKAEPGRRCREGLVEGRSGVTGRATL